MRSQVGQNQREYILSDDETIVSKTDLSGNITYANDDFVRISGFSLEELIGAPQNIVRHPDMPREAFADLWKTIQSGYSWHGLVKNRCKNGDFYWVEATAAPLTKNGKTIGYTSVRVKPDPAQVAAAEAAYAQIRSGNSALFIRDGRVHRRSAWQSIRDKFTLPIHSVLRVYAVFSAIVLLLLGWQTQAWQSGLQMLTIAIGLLTSAVFTVSVHRLISGQVGQLRHHIQAMSAGDLSQPIAIHGRHEISELAQSLRVLQTNMKLLIGQIKQSSGHVHAIGSDVSECSGELAQHTESQKGSLEQTASSMEQITVAVQHNAANSREASEVAIRSAGLADTSGRAVQKVVQTMGAIRHSSSRIADIISVIDGIAFQTNILALNAAVEAARAGDQGRGFSVVASEVRALAQRSASAAKEIKELIQHSVEQVEQGAELVDEAGQSMDELVSGVKKVAALMQEFTVSTQEQSLGISTVNQSVIEIDEMTQQNMQIVSAATYSAEKLEEEVSVLRDLVNAFELTTQQENIIQMQPRIRRAPQEPGIAATHTAQSKQIEQSW